MIKIAGSIRRSYIFPAELPIAYSYYSNLANIFNYLPHISVVKIHDENQFRMLYETVELGAYSIRVFVDIEASFDTNHHAICIVPMNSVKPVKSKASMNGSISQGTFSIYSSFTEAGHQTRIEYTIEIGAELPPPIGLRFMPGSVVDRIAQSITTKRMREIIEGFIENSIEAFLARSPSVPE